MQRPDPQPATLLVMFGATGDLAQRMLLAALACLEADGHLQAELLLLCCARSGFDRQTFIQSTVQSLHAAGCRDDQVNRRLLERVDYRSADLGDPGSLDRLLQSVAERRNGDVLLHLAIAPAWYPSICNHLKHNGLTDAGVRIMLEKPIGHDLASSGEINECIGSAYAEHQVFRVDHYLGKDGVQNLLALRFGNALFEPLWNARHIEQVQIMVAETVGIEGRVDYYDQYGAMRDMVQNHLLQLLCLAAMEPPSHYDADAVRNEKIKVLRSLRPIAGADCAANSVAGQYTAGAIDGAAVPSYRQEAGRDSGTETYVALRAHIDNWRWSGVPFYLRTGKRMPRRITEIYLQFRMVPHSIFPDAGVQPNALTIRLQPEESISLSLMNKTPGLDRDGIRLSELSLDLDLHSAFVDMRRRIAYERLYLDAIEGNGTLFVRRDEIEAAWAWVDGILKSWQDSGRQPKAYPAGTWGPNNAAALTERHGHSWRE